MMAATSAAVYHVFDGRGSTVPPTLTVRLILPSDLDYVLDADKAANIVTDDDFGEITPHWVSTLDEFLAIIRQRRVSASATYETRTYVIDSEGKTDEGYDYSWVCGGFTYELREGLYAVVYCPIHPLALKLGAVATVAAFFRDRMAYSTTRKTTVIYLRDRDEAGLRRLLPLWKAEGFTFAPLRNFYEDGDNAWAGTLHFAATP